MDIGFRLKLARQQAGYTQEQAAGELGVSRQTISNWENNKTYPELSPVIKMSDLYGMSIDRLLREDTDYVSYINKSTDQGKIRFHLSVLVEIAAFFAVWLALLASHFFGPLAGLDDVSYVVLVYVFIFPPYIFVFSAVVGADRHWGRYKWVLLPVFAYSGCFMDFCTFNTGSLFTGGDVFLGLAFEFLPLFMVSFIGMTVGVIVRGAHDRRKVKKEKSNGTGN